ncbi:SOUL family heme-binding protein [Mycobacterium sp. C31M]
MLTRIARTALQFVEGIGGVIGIRIGTEEPLYLSEGRIGRAEIRRYGPRIAAQTSVAGHDQDARSTGFRRLAGYIFGGNHRATPTLTEQRGEQIAMTAPVAQSFQDGSSVIRFYLPSRWSMDTLPEPDDSSITVVEVPGERYAVLSFSGDRSSAAVTAKSAELLAELEGTDGQPDGDPVAWFYDPPWTLPFRRRNEVAVRLIS